MYELPKTILGRTGLTVTRLGIDFPEVLDVLKANGITQ